MFKKTVITGVFFIIALAVVLTTYVIVSNRPLDVTSTRCTKVSFNLVQGINFTSAEGMNARCIIK